MADRTATAAVCGYHLACAALQIREEEIEAAHREQVQRRSAAMLASKANKFATIHTERLKTYRQLAAAKVGTGMSLRVRHVFLGRPPDSLHAQHQHAQPGQSAEEQLSAEEMTAQFGDVSFEKALDECPGCMYVLLQDKVTGALDRRSKSKVIQQYADYGSALYAPQQREGHFPDVIPPGAATAGQLSHTRGVGGNSGSSPATRQLHPAQFVPNSIAAISELEARLFDKPGKSPGATQKQTGSPQKLTYKQRTQAAVQQDVETIHDLLEAAKAATGTRGIGKAWPCPLDEGPASAAALTAAAAAAAAEGQGASRHGLRSQRQGRGQGGSLAAAAAAAAAVTSGGAVRAAESARPRTGEWLPGY
jgi:hypothetical protein